MSQIKILSKEEENEFIRINIKRKTKHKLQFVFSCIESYTNNQCEKMRLEIYELKNKVFWKCYNNSHLIELNLS